MRTTRAVMAISLLTLPMQAIAQTTVIRLEEGSLRGASTGTVLTWKGIPYAAAPVGPLRWRAPQPAPRWTGTRDATASRATCMQTPFGGAALTPVVPPSEDCLFANVWRPAGPTRKLPVLVWVHGGGFTNGSGSSSDVDGARLAARGIVVVSFNYRLGRFGTFAHPALTRADADGGRFGNYGIMDQLAALRWVRDHIAAFGGDPAKVTAMGESAGGISVLAMLTSPAARGLFGQAIIMSGGDGGGRTGPSPTLASAEHTGLVFARSVGIGDNDPDALAKLRALPASKLVDGVTMFALMIPGEHTFSSPFPDGRIIVDGGPALAAGRVTHMPVMIGATADDFGGPTGVMIGGARAVARDLSPLMPVYAYRFSYASDASGKPGAPHASDVPFFFDTVSAVFGERASPRDKVVGDLLAREVIGFAKTGVPGDGGLPAWPRFDPQTNLIMNFRRDGTAAAERDPLDPK